VNNRNIYRKIRIGELTQGAIFNGAVADSYNNSQIYGLIISPRCDLEHGKISTVHYLPLIPLTLWKRNEFGKVFFLRLIKELESSCLTICKNNRISMNLFKHLAYKDILETFLGDVKAKKEKEKFEDCISDLIILSNALLTKKITLKLVNSFMDKYYKISTSIFSRIANNLDKDYFLIESWNDNKSFFIVKLRDIRKINFELVQEIAKGLELNKYSKSQLQANDICPKESDTIVSFQTVLDSPYIEHLIQVFFSNFGRIGVEDFENSIVEELHNQILKL
jgi:hypothetical protein